MQHGGLRGKDPIPEVTPLPRPVRTISQLEGGEAFTESWLFLSWIQMWPWGGGRGWETGLERGGAAGEGGWKPPAPCLEAPLSCIHCWFLGPVLGAWLWADCNEYPQTWPRFSFSFTFPKTLTGNSFCSLGIPTVSGGAPAPAWLSFCTWIADGNDSTLNPFSHEETKFCISAGFCSRPSLPSPHLRATPSIPAETRPNFVAGRLTSIFE